MDRERIFTLEQLVEDENLLKELEEFIKYPSAVLKHLSAGQYAKLSFLTRLHWFLAGDEEQVNYYNKLIGDYVFSRDAILLRGETALIFIDEGELYYHPEWQRRYLKTLLDIVNSVDVKVQIVLTTNSPFIISDILGEDVTYLSEPDNDTAYEMMDCTLGQNIHTLLVENFFMERTIGEYVKELIETIMLCLQKSDDSNQQEKRKAKQDMEKYLGRSPDSYDDFRFLIEKIGEPVYRHYLMKLLEYWEIVKQRIPTAIQRRLLSSCRNFLPDDFFVNGEAWFEELIKAPYAKLKRAERYIREQKQAEYNQECFDAKCRNKSHIKDTYFEVYQAFESVSNAMRDMHKEWGIY